VSKHKQADSELHEDQLLNFLVNALTGAFGISLGENADLDPEDIYEVLVGATADGTSISTLCERSEDSSSGTNILRHLRTKLDLETVKTVGNTLLRQHTLDMLPEQVEIVVDLHLRPYYGDRDETDGLYYNEAKAGTTAFHAYATLYAHVRNKRYTLAVRRLTDGDTASGVLAEFLALVDSLDFEVKALYVDSEFYDEEGVARHGYAADAPFIDTPRQARRHYSKRFGIEATYRLSESSLISTTVTDQPRRLLFVVISLLVQNVWRYLHWEYVATPRRGGRRLWWWPFEEFIRMVTRAAWNALSVRRSVPANRPPDDRFVR